MRNLTLCVLLVTCGTLAALPFRHDSSKSNDLEPSGEATGPTQADLGRTNLNLFVQSDELVHLDPSLSDQLPKWNVPTNQNNTPPVPATFEEIAVPLRLDASDKDRLSVSATKQRRIAAKPAQQSLPEQATDQHLRPLSGKKNSQVARSTNRFGSSFNNHGNETRQRSVLVTPGQRTPGQSKLGQSTPGSSAKQSTTTTLASSVKSGTTETDGDANGTSIKGVSTWHEPVQRLPRRAETGSERHWIRQPE